MKRIVIASIFLLAILTLGAVCAEENQTVISEDNTLEDVQAPIEAEKISNYTYTIENMPEGDVSTFDEPVTVCDLPSDASGNVTMTLNGKVRYDKELSPLHNQLSLDKLNLPFGKYLLEVKYSGDSKYQGFTEKSTFNYNYISFNVPAEVIDGDSDRNAITITYVDNIKGDLEVIIDDELYYESEIERYDYEDFRTELVLDDVEYGTHTYQIRYYNGNYKSLTKKGSFNLTYRLDIEYYTETPIYYGDTVNFMIYTPDLDESAVNLTLNGKNYTVEIYGDGGSISLSEFNVGKNVMSVTYEDEYHPLKTTTITFDVIPKLTAPKEIGYASNQSITLEVPKDITGTLSAKINNEIKTAEIINGKASISLNGLEPGKYNITLKNSVIGELNYTLCVKPNIILPSKSWINLSHKLKFVAPESYNGILKIKDIGDFTVENGTATVELDILKANVYALEISYEEYNWTMIYEVCERSPDWDLGIRSSDTYNVHSDYAIYISPPDYPLPDGTLTVYFDGVEYGQYPIYLFWGEEHEEVYINLDNVSLGNHTVTYEYTGDSYYNPINVTTIVKGVDVQIDFWDYGVDSEIIVLVPYGDEGTITVYVDGEYNRTIPLKTEDDEEEEEEKPKVQYYSIELLDYFTHEIEVRYSGKYGNITKKDNITRSFEFYNTLSGSYAYGSNEMSFSVILPGDEKKTATVYINGTRYYANKDGEIDISKLMPGTYIVNTTYPGDDIYPQRTIIENFTVKGEIQITNGFNEPYYIEYGIGDEISLVLPEDAKGNLTLFIRQLNEAYKQYSTKAIKNGKASLTLPSSMIGTYYAKATFNGSYEVDDFEIQIFVNPSITYPSQMTWGEKKYVTIKTSEVKDAWLIITKTNDEDYASVKFSGTEMKIPLSKLDIGTYDYGYLEARFYVNGTQVYSTDINVKVNAIKSRLVGGKNLNGYYTDTQTYSLKVWGDYGKVVGAGEVVKVKVGSKVHWLKTDKNGVVKIRITNTPGKYAITATYHGTTVKNTLTVKQILALKTVTVKKSAKKLVLTATLKKGKKAIKGKWITFKFNGKTYKAKTNKKGIAKVTVKKPVLKKLKKGKKVTYQATYLKTTVKKTAKVKK